MWANFITRPDQNNYTNIATLSINVSSRPVRQLSSLQVQLILYRCRCKSSNFTSYALEVVTKQIRVRRRTGQPLHVALAIQHGCRYPGILINYPKDNAFVFAYITILSNYAKDNALVFVYISKLSNYAKENAFVFVYISILSNYAKENALVFVYISILSNYAKDNALVFVYISILSNYAKENAFVSVYICIY